MISYAGDLGEEYLNVCVVCLCKLCNLAVCVYILFELPSDDILRFFHPRFSLSVPSDHFAARKVGQAVIGENCMH